MRGIYESPTPGWGRERLNCVVNNHFQSCNVMEGKLCSIMHDGRKIGRAWTRAGYSKDNDVPPRLHVCFKSTLCEPLTCEGRRRVRRPHSREVRAHGSNLVIQGRSGIRRLVAMGHSGGEAGEPGVDREEQGLRRAL